MKRILSVFLIVVLIVSSVSTAIISSSAAESTNLLEGMTADDWYDNNSTGYAGVDIVVDAVASTESRYGGTAIKLTSGSAYRATHMDLPSLAAGTYQLQVEVYHPANSTLTSLAVLGNPAGYSDSTANDPSGEQLDVYAGWQNLCSNATVAVAGWETYTKEITIADGINYDLYIACAAGCDGMVFSDFMLTTKEAVPTLVEGNGTVTTSPKYAFTGSEVTYTAKAGTGDSFLGWYNGDTLLSTETTITGTAGVNTPIAKFTNTNPLGSKTISDWFSDATDNRVLTSAKETTVSRYGGYSFISTSAFYQGLRLPFSVTANKKYVLSFSAKSGAEWEAVSVLDINGLSFSDGGKNSTAYDATDIAARTALNANVYSGTLANDETLEDADEANWTDVTIEFTPAADSTTYALYLAWGNTAGCGNVIISDLKLSSKDTIPTYVEGNGAVKASPAAAMSGEEVILTATAYQADAFRGWYVGDERVSTETTYKISAFVDTVPTAKFTGNNLLDSTTYKDWDATGMAVNDGSPDSRWGGKNSIKFSGSWRGTHLTLDLEEGETYTLSFAYYLPTYTLGYDSGSENIDLKLGTNVSYGGDGQQTDGIWIQMKTLDATVSPLDAWSSYSFEFIATANTADLAIGAGWNAGIIMSDFSLVKKKAEAAPEGTQTIANWKLADDKTAASNTEVVTAKNGGYAFMLKGYQYRGLYTTAEVEEGQEYIVSFSTKSNMRYEYIYIGERPGVGFNAEGKTPLDTTVSLTSLNAEIPNTTDFSSVEWEDVSYAFIPEKSGTYYIALSFNETSAEDGRAIISDFKVTKIKKYKLAVSADDNLGFVEPAGLVEVFDGKEVTITATPLSDNEFLGWYNAKGKRVSKNEAYTYTFDEDDVQTYTAKFKKGSLAIENASFENKAKDTTFAWLDETTGELKQNDKNYSLDTINKGEGAEFYQKIQLNSSDSHTGKQSLSLVSGASFAGYSIDGLEKNTTYSLSYFAKLSSEANVKTFVTDGGLSPFVEFDESYQYYVEKITPNALGEEPTVTGTGDWQKITVNFNTGNATDIILWWHFNGGNTILIDTLSLIKTHRVNIIGGKGGTAIATETGYVKEGNSVTFKASAFDGNKFEGWYEKESNKLYNKKASFTEVIKNPIDIYAKFSGNNMPVRDVFAEKGWDGTFENGTVDGWIVRDPDYPYHNNRWCSWMVSEKQAFEGINSLRINARIRNSLLPITNLNKNTKYLLSFYFYQPDATGEAYVKYFGVVDPDSQSLSTAKTVYAKTEGKIDGGAGWHKVNLYFETAEETDVSFISYHWAPDNSGDTDSQFLYIDNLSLVEYSSNEDLQNGSFKNANEYWQLNNPANSSDNNALILKQTDDTAYQIVNVGTDKRAVVRFKAKGKAFAAVTDVAVFNPTISNAVSSLSYVETSGDWNTYEFEVYTAAHPDIKLFFKALDGECSVDDVSITVMDSSIGGVLENIDFETERFDIKNSDSNLWSIYDASGAKDSNVHSGDKSLHLSYDPNKKRVETNYFKNITANDFVYSQNMNAAGNTEVVTAKKGGSAFMLKGHAWQGVYLPFTAKGGEEYTLSFSTKSNNKFEYVIVTNRTDLAFRSDDGKTAMFNEDNSTIAVEPLNKKLHNSSDLSGAKWCDVSYTFKPDKSGTYYFALSFSGDVSEARTIISDLSLTKREEKLDSNLFNEAYMSYNSVLGVSYKVSLYYKITDGKNGGKICITPEKSGSICKEIGTKHSAKDNGWQKLEFMFVNAQYTNLRTYIANIMTKAKCDVYIDDIKIEVINPLIIEENIKDSYAELIYNVIENGAFEDEINDQNFKDLPKTCKVIEDESKASSGQHYLTVKKGTKYVLPLKVKNTTVYNFGATIRADKSAKGFVGIAVAMSPDELYYSNTKSEVASKLNAVDTNGKWQRNGFKLITNVSGYVYLVIECTQGEFDLDTLMLFEEAYASKKDVNDYSLDPVYDFDDLNSANCIYNGGYEDEQALNGDATEEDSNDNNQDNDTYFDAESNASPDTSDKGLPIVILLVTLACVLAMLLFSKRKVIDMLTKSNVTKMLCLLLSVTISLSLLGGCKKKPAQSSSQPASSQEEITSNDTESEVESEEETYEEETVFEEYDDFYGTDDFEQIEDTETEEPESSGDDYYDEFDANNVKFEVYNSQEPINTEYRGVSSSIYHAFGFMKDQFDGRVYNDKMMDLELDRLVDSGIKLARTRYDSRWAWDKTAGKYDWNKNRFQYFLDFAEELQSRGVNVAIQLGWEFNALVYNESNHSLGEVDYLLGRGNDVYGENKGVDFTGKTEEEARLIRAANRMGYWIAETLKQAKAQRGINNISHLFYFIEPSGSSIFKAQNMSGEEADEYLLVTRTIKDKLAAEGVASWAKHVGPNQGFANEGADLLNFVISRDPDLFDIWTAHAYPKAENVLSNVYYDMIKPLYDINTTYVKDAGVFETTEFWWDEFHTQAVELSQKDGSAWLGLQQVVCYLAAQHAGVDNINMWQIFDQLFTDYLGQDGGEFFDGIHMVGTAPSLFKSSIPRPQYYFTSLFSKYNGYQNGTVFQTNNDFAMIFADVYIGAVQLENGDYTITVVNVGVDDVNFEVLFDTALNKNLYRHRVNANDVEPTTKAQLAPADATFVDVKDKFKDVVRGGDMIIYTSVKG